MSQKDQLEDQIQTMLDKVLDDDKDDNDFFNYIEEGEELPSFLDDKPFRKTAEIDNNFLKRVAERPKTAYKQHPIYCRTEALFNNADDYCQNNNQLLSTSLSNNSNLRY
jgi:hypothetical protein